WHFSVAPPPHFDSSGMVVNPPRAVPPSRRPPDLVQQPDRPCRPAPHAAPPRTTTNVLRSPTREPSRMKSIAFSLLALVPVAPLHAAPLELKPGDHICIIGNTLADRMQHDGWLEPLLHSRFPKHDLVIRNLGYSGDELPLNRRLRSMDFGTPDQWLSASAPVPQPRKLNPDAPVRQNRFELTNTKADVIFAFFGYNESYADVAR